MRAGHAWRKIGSMLRTTIEENSIGNRSPERPRIRLDDCAKVDAGRIRLDITIKDNSRKIGLDGKEFVWRYGLNGRETKKRKKKIEKKIPN